jgi:hypothetical protein
MISIFGSLMRYFDPRTCNSPSEISLMLAEVFFNVNVKEALNEEYVLNLLLISSNIANAFGSYCPKDNITVKNVANKSTMVFFMIF